MYLFNKHSRYNPKMPDHKDLESCDMEEVSLKSGETDSDSPWHIRVYNKVAEAAIYLRWLVCC
jgi:hypothetical protein